MGITEQTSLRINYPKPPERVNSSIWGFNAGLAITTLNATGKKDATILYPPKTGTINKIQFQVVAKTTNGDVDVRLETVDATTGYPTGTLATAGSNATQTITATGTYNVTLGTGHVVSTQQTPLAIVITNTTGSYNIGHPWQDQGTDGRPIAPYTAAYDGTSWSRSGFTPNAFPGYSDGSYAASPGLWPAGTYGFASASSTGLLALRARLPFPVRVIGLWWFAMGVPSNDWTLRLYDSDGATVLGSISGDKDFSGLGLIARKFDAAIDLVANTYYRVSLHTGSGTENVGYYDASSAAIMDALDAGQDAHYSTAASLTPANNAAWTDTLTRRPMLGLIVSGFDAGGSGGGAGARGF